MVPYNIHILRWFLQLKIDIFPNSFLMKKAHQNNNFISQLLRLLLRYSKMLLGMQFFKYAVTYLLDFALLFKYFWSSVLQIYSAVSRVSMMVTVAHCFVAIFSMLLEYIVTGLIMCCFYACLIDHFLVSISMVLHYNTIQYNTIQYNTIQYNTIQYNTIQYNTIQYNTIQYNTIQYNTIQYNTTLLSRT